VPQSKHAIKVGPPDVSPDLASHTPGVHSGNSKGRYEMQTGHKPDGTSTAARSTGINAHQRDPIIPGMPNLSPA